MMFKADDNVQVSSYDGGTFQEIRLTHNGGGPAGMELVFHSDQHGIAIKIWHPFNHEWVTINTYAFLYHGNTARTATRKIPDLEDFADFEPSKE